MKYAMRSIDLLATRTSDHGLRQRWLDRYSSRTISAICFTALHAPKYYQRQQTHGCNRTDPKIDLRHDERLISHCTRYGASR